MAIIQYKNVDYTVVYIDPTLELTLGDGSTAEKALKEIPTTLTTNTCYLVRRTTEDYEIYVQHQVDSTLENVMFLGYPKASDKNWIKELITDDVKVNDWEDDEAKYANIRFWYTTDSSNYNSTNRACISATSLKYLTFINCYLYRSTPASSSSSSYYRFACPYFYSKNSETNFAIYQCKLGVKDVNLDDDTYLDSNNGIFSDSYNYYIGRMYFVFDYANSIKIQDCVINSIGFLNSSYGGSTVSSYDGYFASTSAIHSNYCKLFQLKDCVVNSAVLAYYGTSENYNHLQNVFHIGEPYDTYTGSVSVDNIQYNVIPTSCGFQGLFRYNYNNALLGSEISITNINVDFKKFGQLDLSKTAQPSWRYCGISVYDPYFRELLIDNIHFNGNKDVKIKNAYCMRLDLRGKNCGNQNSGTVKNISIELAEESDIFTTPTTLYKTIEFDSSIGASGNSGVGFGTYTGGNQRYNTQDYTVYKDIKFVAPYGYMELDQLNCSFDEVVGGLKVYYGTSVDIKKLTQKKINTQTITVGDSCNYVRIREFESDPTFTAKLINNHFWNSVYIDKSNAEIFDTTIADTGTTYGQYCCMNTKNDGELTARNMNTFAQSWSVTNNQSSSPACLKLWSNTNSSYPLFIGTDPYKGFEVTPDDTGDRKLIARFAHSTDVTDEVTGAKKFVLVIRIPRIGNDGEEYYETIYSSYDDWKDSDATWDDPYVTAKTIEIPVEITVLKPIEVKVAYNWYSSTGYTYFDPDITIK
jgi:hypothetical protein